MPATEHLLRQAESFLRELGDGTASVELPAGCGKTEAAVALVEAAVAERRRSLLLTHTNAGASAIRRRLARYAVRGAITVSTLDSFMQRVARAFPSLGPVVEQDEGDDGYWPLLRSSAVTIAEAENVREIVCGSYDVAIIDEYQDCSIDQHRLVTLLSDRIPTIVLGDPMQAIFGFGGTVLVAWDEVLKVFPAAAPFDVRPYRWAQANPALGEWLLHDVRRALDGGEPVDLHAVDCITRSFSDEATKRAVPFGYVGTSGSTVFIVATPWESVSFAKGLKGHFPTLEDVGMRRATAFARQLDEADDGAVISAHVISFLMDSTSRLGEALGGKAPALARVREGKLFAPKKRGPEARLQLAVNELTRQPSPTAILEVFRRADEVPGASCFARERLRDAASLLRIVEAGRTEGFPTPLRSSARRSASGTDEKRGRLPTRR